MNKFLLFCIYRLSRCNKYRRWKWT